MKTANFITKPLVCSAALLCLLWVEAASADVIYDNNLGAVSFATLSDPLGTPPFSIPQFAADSFVLQAGANTITGIHWTGLYFPSNTPTNLPSTDNFVIQIYLGSPIVPVSPLVSFNVGSAANRSDTGIDLVANGVAYDLFSYSVNIAPVSLAAGPTYWLSIFNQTFADPDDGWFWGAASGGSYVFRSGAGAPWIRVVGELDFELTGAITGTVPEPATLALLGLSLAALGATRRRSPPRESKTMLHCRG